MALLETKWQASLPDSGYEVTTVLSNHAGLYAGSNGYAYRLDPMGGAPLATNGLRGMEHHEVRLAAPADASLLVVGTNGYALGLDPDSLATLWQTSLPDSGFEVVSVLCAGGSVYAGTNGYVYRMNAGGTVQATNGLSGMGKHEVRLGISDDQTTLFVGTNGYALGLDAVTLETRWTNNLPGSGHDVTSVLGGTGVAYAACNGFLYQLAQSDGSQQSLNDLEGTGKNEVRLAMDADREYLYAATNGHGIGLRPDSLATVYSVSLPGSGYSVTDVVAGDGVAYFANNGYVFEIDTGGRVTARNPLSGMGRHETRLAISPDLETALYVGINGYAAGLALAGYPSYDGPWMAQLAPQIGPMQLRRVAVPGTHDSGTYGIDALSDVGLDMPAWLKYVMLLPLPKVVVGAIMANWGVAQGENFASQLNSGIRYLDLRVQGGGTPRFVHGLVGSPVSELVEQLSAFLAQPGFDREIVFLDFSHFYGMTPAMHRQLVAQLRGALGNRLAPASLGTDVTLEKLWGTPYRVITFYDDDASVAANPFLWPQSDISSPWPNVQDVGALRTALRNELPNTRTDFFVLQGVLTPDGGVIAAGLKPFSSAPDSLASQAEGVNPQLLAWLGGWKSMGINIVICDWFNLSNFVDVVVGLNRAGAHAEFSEQLSAGAFSVADVARRVAAAHRRIAPRPSAAVEAHLQQLESGAGVEAAGAAR